jgi:dCMP deaminase
MNRWDKYFLSIAEAVAQKSSCYSRKLGAVLVRDNAIISTGFNGVARGIPDCSSRYEKDLALMKHLAAFPSGKAALTCPRRILGFGSGEGMQWCYARHAEENAITQAARSGVSTKGSTLYLNWKTPCLHCLQACINAGVLEIVVTELASYNEQAQFIIDHTKIKIRTYDL